MDDWQQLLKNSLTEPKEIAERFNLDSKELELVAKEFKIRVTPYYASLIKEKGDAIYKQVIPDPRELAANSGVPDPLSEDHDSPVPSIVHRYPDRALFLVSHSCASYCRFCTRKRKVGDSTKINPRDIEDGLDYLRKHSEVRDVIISGGDPLMLSDNKLEHILKSLRAIPHLEILRIGTRIPCFLPQRITPKLTEMLKRYHPLWMNVHFNHPDELTPESQKALALLADAGIPLGCQTVLLKGVNDDPVTMKRLMQKLVASRVRPYYIYQADYVKGTEYLRTRVEKGIEIMENLRGWTSGLAVPYFCIDAPGGGGKIPLLPQYLQQIDDEKVVMRNYEGQAFVYPQIQEGDAKRKPVGRVRRRQKSIPVDQTFADIIEVG
jgi:lysine 2,3-aminomutase